MKEQLERQFILFVFEFFHINIYLFVLFIHFSSLHCFVTLCFVFIYLIDFLYSIHQKSVRAEAVSGSPKSPGQGLLPTPNTPPMHMTSQLKIAHQTMSINVPLEASCVAVNSPLDFVIQPVKCLKEAGKVTLELKSRIEKDPRPVISVCKGQYVASKFSQDTEVSWYRCRVESVSGERCKVFFLDYGNSEEVDISGLRQLKPQDCQMPACTIVCKIDGCTAENVKLDELERILEV